MRATRAYFVARVGRDVVGYAGLMLMGDDGHVTTIAVHPAWHRHQIGTRLLLALVHEARARETLNLTLEVRMGNRGAEELYLRLPVRIGRCAQGVLRRDERGRNDHVGERRQRAGVRRAPQRVGIEHSRWHHRREPTSVVGAQRRRRNWVTGCEWVSDRGGVAGATRRDEHPLKILGLETSCDETAAAVVPRPNPLRRARCGRPRPGVSISRRSRHRGVRRLAASACSSRHGPADATDHRAPRHPDHSGLDRRKVGQQQRHSRPCRQHRHRRSGQHPVRNPRRDRQRGSE